MYLRNTEINFFKTSVQADKLDVSSSGFTGGAPCMGGFEVSSSGYTNGLGSGSNKEKDKVLMIKSLVNKLMKTCYIRLFYLRVK